MPPLLDHIRKGDVIRIRRNGEESLYRVTDVAGCQDFAAAMTLDLEPYVPEVKVNIVATAEQFGRALREAATSLSMFIEQFKAGESDGN